LREQGVPQGGEDAVLPFVCLSPIIPRLQCRTIGTKYLGRRQADRDCVEVVPACRWNRRAGIHAVDVELQQFVIGPFQVDGGLRFQIERGVDYEEWRRRVMDSSIRAFSTDNDARAIAERLRVP